MDQKIVILVLCGLPGAGKTTFAHNIQNYVLTFASLPGEKRKQTAVKSTWDEWTAEVQFLDQGNNFKFRDITCVHVCYDDIVPNELHGSHSLANKTEKEVSPWKVYRKQIHSCVERDIQNYLSSSQTVQNSDIPDDVIRKYTSMKQSHKILSDDGHPVKVIIIDDNMFFQSMRYEYFQLARKYNTGFAEIYINCSTVDAHDRNRSREIPVSDESMKNIAAKFERPDTTNHWEVLSMTLDAATCCQNDNLHEACRMIFHAVTHPVEREEIDEEARCMARVVCSQSVLHQADQIMRKLIGVQMTELKDTQGHGKDYLKQRAAKLNQIRTDLLEDMKSAKWHIPSDFENHILDASKNCDNPLFCHVKDVFESRLHMNE